MSYVSPFSGDIIQPTDVSFRSFTIAADTTLAWPIIGNTDGNYAARIMEVTASSAGLSLLMPPADQTSVGTDALIKNLGANTFTVEDYDGNTITTVAAGEAKYIFVKTNATTAGTWGTIVFGSSTSAADANALAGYGLLAIASTLNQSHPVTSVYTSFSFAASDRAKVISWASGTGTGTLPQASSLGNNWFVLFKNSGTGTLTVDTTGGEYIDGNTTKDFAPNESAFIICTGTGYVTVGYGVSTVFAFSSFVKTVTSGSYTLSANEASNTIQEYIGSLSGNVTVNYPPVVNLYVVSNQTTDNGYSLTLTTGTGGADAIVPPGEQQTLVCDGSNFFNANTSQSGVATTINLANGTVSAPSLKFATETGTGIYHPTSGALGVAVLGVNVGTFDPNGLNIEGTGNFENGVSGGLF